MEEAKRDRAAVVERNAQGDEGVSALDLLTAEAEVTRREGLASATAIAVREAQAAETPALADHYANVIDERLRKATHDQEETAIEAVSAALSHLIDQVAERNALIRESVADARAAGVVPGERNDDRITFGLDFALAYPRLHTIKVDGQAFRETDPPRTILSVLEQAVGALGYRLTAPGSIELRALE